MADGGLVAVRIVWPVPVRARDSNDNRGRATITTTTTTRVITPAGVHGLLFHEMPGNLVYTTANVVFFLTPFFQNLKTELILKY